MMYHYNDNWYTIKELADMSGVKPATIRDRLRRGYTIDQSVKQVLVDESIELFNDASWWEDWIGMSTLYLYKIYWDWCVSDNGYTPVSHVMFTRQLLTMYPNLKVVCTRKNGSCCRIIRER